MKIRRLTLENFGPFKQYEIEFVEEDNICLLLTGKNNEGKSSIINALKLVSAAARVVGKRRQEIVVDDDYYYKLLQQDTERVLIGRLIHNYQDIAAKIIAEFRDNLDVIIYVDPIQDLIYAENRGRIPSNFERIFGFIPPLGPLAENEDIIVKTAHLIASLNTSLAPRHLRNHLYQMLTPDEYSLVKKIINESWQDIELLDYELNHRDNKIYCYFRESKIEREISWAGQGLQVWFQIIAHLVRLRNSSVLILDEPEINLHPEKQNDLIRIIRDNFNGSVIIATHSVELMNNVNVSHILNVRKVQSRPKIKTTKDRVNLELVRSQIGSNFNLIASQFEDFDLIIFTEDNSDFYILDQLANLFKIHLKAFNIPLHGFNEYKKAKDYKFAYELLIGKNIKYTIVLDRDYYPDVYLTDVKNSLETTGIRVAFTIGKEIENIFLSPNLILNVIPDEHLESFRTYWGTVLECQRLDCFGSFISLHKQFLPSKFDSKTVTTNYTPIFERTWSDTRRRYNIIAGKNALKKLREFCQKELGKSLSQKHLIELVINSGDSEIKRWIEYIYHITQEINQELHY